MFPKYGRVATDEWGEMILTEYVPLWGREKPNCESLNLVLVPLMHASLFKANKGQAGFNTMQGASSEEGVQGGFEDRQAGNWKGCHAELWYDQLGPHNFTFRRFSNCPACAQDVSAQRQLQTANT